MKYKYYNYLAEKRKSSSNFLLGLSKYTMFKNNIRRFTQKLKALHGDPHYVALGMGIGVFVAITPTIPFHTILAITLAFVFKASKPAAILGVWVSNPFTVVFLYAACYEAGFLVFEDSSGGFESILMLIDQLESNIRFSQKLDHFAVFLQTQLKTFMVMNLGGLILGIPSGVVSYYVTKRFFLKRQQSKEKKIQQDEENKTGNS